MSTRCGRAWRPTLSAGGLCLIAAAAVGGCGKTGPARGGLMLIVSSDGPLPLDRLDIGVSNNESGKNLLSNRYRVPQEASLPTTVAIVSNGDAAAQVKISVTGWEGSVPLDRRDAIVTQVPTDRVAALTVVLSARCSDKLTVGMDGSARSDCGDGNTCDGKGNCVSATVAAGALPVYRVGDENDAGLSEASSNGGSGGQAGMGAVTTGGASGTGGASPVDLCKGVTCKTPPDNGCNSGVEFQSYDQIGSCTDGVCSYVSHKIACTCQNGTCTTDPCIAVTCTTPPTAVCKTAAVATTYAAMGTCSAGTCSYTPTDAGCGTNQACAGAGVCSVCKADLSCGGSCGACTGTKPKCKDLATTSQCVGCLSDADCTGTTPSCNTTTNVCGPQPSCIGLASTCGPSGNASCCASSAVTGGTFNRSNDASYPATVSNFRLDTYEITVGRFRKFWSGYPGNMPASGSGKNPNNPSDEGWDATWNTSALPPSQAELTTNISCNATYQTWTAGNDALPMNCLNWYEAEAFCIWDGGRLPTEAEWNYAAAGGAAQRAYPWGSVTPDCTYANCFGAAGGTDSCVAPGTGGANRVGSESPKGDGLYGQADLAGNVWEWVQDGYGSPYTNPCNNCTYMHGPTGGNGVQRGGAFNNSASLLLSSAREIGGLLYVLNPYYVGGRCARTH